MGGGKEGRVGGDGTGVGGVGGWKEEGRRLLWVWVGVGKGKEGGGGEKAEMGGAGGRGGAMVLSPDLDFEDGWRGGGGS